MRCARLDSKLDRGQVARTGCSTGDGAGPAGAAVATVDCPVLEEPPVEEVNDGSSPRGNTPVAAIWVRAMSVRAVGGRLTSLLGTMRTSMNALDWLPAVSATISAGSVTPGGLGFVEAGLTAIGRDGGRVRPPLTDLLDHEVAELASLVDKIS